jgi:diadenosine tetraphosphate (Ap4A) HIT family hydrolase
MKHFRVVMLAVAVLLLPGGLADVRNCACDAARPETLDRRECSLCRAADAQPEDVRFFAVRDANPNKPNRWLALPRFHGTNPQDLSGMTPEERTAYWGYTIKKAAELWGDKWGLAINSLERRTQCHMHIHIGKLRDGVEDEKFIAVNGPAEIPLPREGDGLWAHPAGRKLHVHWGNDAPELLLEH